MAVLPVLTYPHPLLKQKAPEAGSGSPFTPTIFEDLKETLKSHPGCVGLAAPQVGHLVRVIVADASRASRPCENHGLLCLINPVIQLASQWKVGREGCLSFPDLLANVKRAQKIRISAMNENFEPITLDCLGFEAVILQHEVDHLDGILFLDRIRSSKDLFERRKTPTGLVPGGNAF